MRIVIIADDVSDGAADIVFMILNMNLVLYQYDNNYYGVMKVVTAAVILLVANIVKIRTSIPIITSIRSNSKNDSNY